MRCVRCPGSYFSLFTAHIISLFPFSDCVKGCVCNFNWYTGELIIACDLLSVFDVVAQMLEPSSVALVQLDAAFSGNVVRQPLRDADGACLACNMQAQ